MNILYLIDPNSIHDQKWISFFTEKSGYECFFICRRHHYNKELIDQFEINFKIKFRGTIDYFSFKRIGSSIKQVFTIKQVIDINNIHLFHIQFAEPNALWAFFRRVLGVPIIITCRGTDVLKTIPNHFNRNDIFNKLIAWAYKKSLNNADWVTFTSKSQWDSIRPLIDRKDNISVIRTGVNLIKLEKDTSGFFPKNMSKPFILFPRYLKPIYNHEFAIEAAKKLSSDLKQKYQMVFVGKDAGDIEYQNQLIQMLKEDREIDFLFLEKQKQESIWELYKNAELIIMTPKSDGSPVSGMEAIALNKRLILGPLEYDKDIFNEPNIFQLEKWSSDELSSLIEEVLKKVNTNVKPTVQYLNKIDRDHNMKILEKTYQNLIVGN
ncbi:glycosyltransferase [uncultured Marivirga sp.]|uniref:glycosyltransferase n=1 Tax=uncultured Marivirga sp. TaxID=1123707 RepID=UPI0030EB8EF6|tara:strand:+ start:36482 stop:37618 length:1137 start_codon:yes stop_codon:yes gene_type:complete